MLIEYFFIFLIFASFGLGLEVVFTAVTGYFERKDRVHLFGFSSLWYAPIYGVIIPVGYTYLLPLIAHFNIVTRGLIYGVLFHVGEYITMWILHAINGESPSEESYRKSKWHIHGFTKPEYFPAFVVLGIFMEVLFVIVMGGLTNQGYIV